ncbi:hypothetical protein SFOMI_5158 [Sphingobium fuliginis]|uniref:Uncharacterized protein n=1 Tax=Sphingobium fuliginis (strain ATCC 27551) TaxID=336203 RepID=A0A292ZN74_SPHSA|nr:hypothetical protein SFOMI_5158 [Sphingobium fuliginis]
MPAGLARDSSHDFRPWLPVQARKSASSLCRMFGPYDQSIICGYSIGRDFLLNRRSCGRCVVPARLRVGNPRSISLNGRKFGAGTGTAALLPPRFRDHRDKAARLHARNVETGIIAPGFPEG